MNREKGGEGGEERGGTNTSHFSFNCSNIVQSVVEELLVPESREKWERVVK